MSIGFFGKLPSQGDFVTRGLPNPWVEGLDAWISHTLALVQAKPNWLEGYLSSPAWQFRWQGIEGLCDDKSLVCGVIAPSLDGVGRYFPLTVVWTDAAPRAASAQIEVLDGINTLVLQAIDEDWQPDFLYEQLTALVTLALSNHPAQQSTAPFIGPAQPMPTRLFSAQTWGELALESHQTLALELKQPASLWLAKPAGERAIALASANLHDPDLASLLWGGLDAAYTRLGITLP